MVFLFIFHLFRLFHFLRFDLMTIHVLRVQLLTHFMRYFTVELLAAGMTFFTFLCVFFFIIWNVIFILFAIAFIILFGISEGIESLKAEVSTHLQSSFNFFNYKNLLVFGDVFFLIWITIGSAEKIIAVIAFRLAMIVWFE